MAPSDTEEQKDVFGEEKLAIRDTMSSHGNCHPSALPLFPCPLVRSAKHFLIANMLYTVSHPILSNTTTRETPSRQWFKFISSFTEQLRLGYMSQTLSPGSLPSHTQISVEVLWLQRQVVGPEAEQHRVGVECG